MAELFVWTAGKGTRAVSVHGSGSSGENFLHLAESIPGYLVVAPDRPNYGRSPEAIPSSVDAEVEFLGRLLDGGAHLFGQSYGGFLCLLIAARWPEKVRSLAVNEPPAFQLAPRDGDVQALLRRLGTVYPPRADDTPQEWNDRWGEALGMPPDPAPLSPAEERATIAMMREQPPWEVGIDLERIARAPFPKLVLSGGWSRAFSAVCDVLERGLGARRIDFPGAGHSLAGHRDRWVPLLKELWQSADR